MQNRIQYGLGTVLLEAIEAMRLKRETKRGATMRPASGEVHARMRLARASRDRLYALIVCWVGRVTTRQFSR